ncbi:MAG TPA: LemA family protein [Candidatus Dietzia intestinipullorum]|nr:LemA family protein [Candidatus Dietzia intestinipullorum]
MSAEVALIVVVLVVAVLVAAALLLAYLTAHRLDRLHIRTDLARTALAGALGRRHAVAAAVTRELTVTAPLIARDVSEALAAARHHPADRVTGDDPAPAPGPSQLAEPGDDESAQVEQAENDLGLLLATVDPASLPDDLAAELDDASDRVAMARRFYNDAVRDTRGLRERAVVRGLRLAGRAPMPDYVELVDAPPRPGPGAAVEGSG